MDGLDIPWVTAKRAKRKIGIISKRVGDAWQWSLPQTKEIKDTPSTS
jgi:hypothetical protein